MRIRTHYIEYLLTIGPQTAKLKYKKAYQYFVSTEPRPFFQKLKWSLWKTSFEDSIHIGLYN
jgi:hypothetical protein